MFITDKKLNQETLIWQHFGSFFFTASKITVTKVKIKGKVKHVRQRKYCERV